MTPDFRKNENYINCIRHIFDIESEENMVALTKNNKIITVLWVLGILAFIGYVYFAINETNSEFKMNISLTTNQEIISLLIVLTVLTILSLVLKGSTYRLVNLIGGVVCFIGFLAVFIDAITVNLYGIYNVMMGVDVIIMIFIIALSYKIPKSQP